MEGPQAHGHAPAATGLSQGLAPALPASDRAAHARSGQNVILFGWHALDGDFCRLLSLWRPGERRDEFTFT